VSLASVASATRNSQPDIVTSLKAKHGPIPAEPAFYWRELAVQTWNSHDINVYISAEWSRRSTENRVSHDLPAYNSLI
jgi:hypothetical protein